MNFSQKEAVKLGSQLRTLTLLADKLMKQNLQKKSSTTMFEVRISTKKYGGFAGDADEVIVMFQAYSGTTWSSEMEFEKVKEFLTSKLD